MAQRDYPYSNFNFIVNLGGDTGSGDTPIGGFSECSGLSTEVNYSEYRPGNAKVNTTSRYPNTFKVGTLTLKRGLMGSVDLWTWLKDVRDGKYSPRSITVTLQDEEHKPVMAWDLHNAQPQKWTAPNLTGKGGGDVAMEEFVLVYESFNVKPL
jgi:phage tail-like protein